MAEATGKTVDQSADDRGDSAPRSERIRQWLTLFLLIYCLVCAVSIIGDGFSTATGDHAEQLFNFATNPFVGLMVGIMATSLIQSSSTVTSIIVAMVAGGLPVGIAVPMVMGANIGTTMTNTLVSLGHVRHRDEFRRAFAAATVHDFFNFLAVVILLPLEILFSPLERLAEQVAVLFYGDADLSIDNANLIGMATDPVTGMVDNLASILPTVLSGIVMIALGIAAIFLAIRYIGKLLRKLMVGRARRIMNGAIGRGPVAGVTSGALVTLLVQSSSTTTSLMVPLAGSGTFSLKQIYPFTIGSNIGTTFTALLAATAISGANATLALEIALVHLFFNLLAMLVIGGLPFLRLLPVKGALRLGELAAERKVLAAAWVMGAFIALPAALIAITAVTG
ncbi:Na/Pi symporter [Kushneria sp. AK178]